MKSRDITLPTKVHLVKAMVFPVVMCGLRVVLQRKLGIKELMLLNCADVGNLVSGVPLPLLKPA